MTCIDSVSTHVGRSDRLSTIRSGFGAMVGKCGRQMVTIARTAAKPVTSLGGFFAMTFDTFVQMFQPPFAWHEYVMQTWFVARVSVLPALLLTMPFAVLLTFTFNILLTEFGAADFSGTGAAIGTVGNYTYNIFLPAYAAGQLKIPASTAYTASTVAAVVLMA